METEKEMENAINNIIDAKEKLNSLESSFYCDPAFMKILNDRVLSICKIITKWIKEPTYSGDDNIIPFYIISGLPTDLDFEWSFIKNHANGEFIIDCYVADYCKGELQCSRHFSFPVAEDKFNIFIASLEEKAKEREKNLKAIEEEKKLEKEKRDVKEYERLKNKFESESQKAHDHDCAIALNSRHDCSCSRSNPAK